MAAISADREPSTRACRASRPQRQTIAMIDSTPRRRRGAYVQQYAAEISQEIQTMTQSMQNELVTLAPLSGKKSFLFVTGGFEYQPGYVMAQYASGSVAAPSLDFRRHPAGSRAGRGARPAAPTPTTSPSSPSTPRA